MNNEQFKITSSPGGILTDEMDSVQPVCLKHVLPSTLFTISLTDGNSFVMRTDGSIIDTQSFQEWETLAQFCEEMGYSPESSLDAWHGEVVNPDWQSD